MTIDHTRRDHVDAAIAELRQMAAAEPRVVTGTTLAAGTAGERTTDDTDAALTHSLVNH